MNVNPNNPANDPNGQLDQLLDRVLAGYAGEPRTGLENRMLARLRSQEAKRPFFRWEWLIAGAAAAILIATISIGLELRHRRQQELVSIQAPPARQQIAYNSVPSPGKLEVPNVSSAPARSSRSGGSTGLASSHAAHSEGGTALGGLSSRPAQFPTPTPLSTQEKLLLRLAARQDSGTPAQPSPSAEVKPKPDVSAQEIVIEPLKINPLEPAADSQQQQQDGPQQSNRN
jgi:hypothetical protein